jgi:hypothetical protein
MTKTTQLLLDAEIQAIVADTIEYIYQEFFETTVPERDDFKAFLTERLQQVTARAIVGSELGFYEEVCQCGLTRAQHHFETHAAPQVGCKQFQAMQKGTP